MGNTLCMLYFLYLVNYFVQMTGVKQVLEVSNKYLIYLKANSSVL